MDIAGELEQLTPQHSSQLDVQSSPCFLQLQRFESQLLLHEQRITFNRSDGAAGISVVTGTRLSHSSLQPHCVGSTVRLLPSHSWTCKYTLRLWNRAAADVGGRVWTCTNVHSSLQQVVHHHFPLACYSYHPRWCQAVVKAHETCPTSAVHLKQHQQENVRERHAEQLLPCNMLFTAFGA